MPVGLEQQQGTVTAIQRMETTCGTVTTPVPKYTLLDRKARTRGDYTTCTEMYGSGVLTGGGGEVIWSMVRTPKVLPGGRIG